MLPPCSVEEGVGDGLSKVSEGKFQLKYKKIVLLLILMKISYTKRKHLLIFYISKIKGKSVHLCRVSVTVRLFKRHYTKLSSKK